MEGHNSNNDMRTLEEDLLKMDSLHGNELDAHLYEMKALYTKPEEKETIRKHLDKTLDTIADNIESISNRLTIRERNLKYLIVP